MGLERRIQSCGPLAVFLALTPPQYINLYAVCEIKPPLELDRIQVIPPIRLPRGSAGQDVCYYLQTKFQLCGHKIEDLRLCNQFRQCVSVVTVDDARICKGCERNEKGIQQESRREMLAGDDDDDDDEPADDERSLPELSIRSEEQDALVDPRMMAALEERIEDALYRE